MNGQNLRDCVCSHCQKDPTAFASQYEYFAQSTDEKWQGYLENALEEKISLLQFAIEDGKAIGVEGMATQLMHTLLNRIKQKRSFIKLKQDVNPEQAAAAAKLYEKLGFKK